MIRLADDLMIWRATHRITQQEAADLIGCSLRQLGRWEREEARPREDYYNTVRWVISQPPYNLLRSAEEPAK